MFGAALRAVVVVVSLTMVLALPPKGELKDLVNKLLHEKMMMRERSTHWGMNMTTVSMEGM